MIALTRRVRKVGARGRRLLHFVRNDGSQKKHRHTGEGRYLYGVALKLISPLGHFSLPQALKKMSCIDPQGAGAVPALLYDQGG